MRFAYADPPYLGMCGRYGHNHNDGERPFDGHCWDEAETHRLLIDYLSSYDGWSLSLHLPSLATILPMCPPDSRILAWCKSWASWKPGVFPAYAWEPVIFHGAKRKRRYGGGSVTPSDWFVTHCAQFGFFGAKPEPFTWWIMDCLGIRPEDEFEDLFAGSGLAGRSAEKWRQQTSLGLDDSPKPRQRTEKMDLA